MNRNKIWEIIAIKIKKLEVLNYRNDDNNAKSFGFFK